MSKSVEQYLAEGCGRCSLGGTPECKVNKWHWVLLQLRDLLNECGLQEEMKWGVPCYTFKGKNIVLLGAFKDYCVLSFFKGALLADTEGILSPPGENTQAARVIRFTDSGEIIKQTAVLRAYIFEAIEVEKTGIKVVFKDIDEYELPEELQKKFKESLVFKEAFEALTPGRKRGYLFHFSSAKQSKTRLSRIEKCIPMILLGKGFGEYSD